MTVTCVEALGEELLAMVATIEKGFGEGIAPARDNHLRCGAAGYNLARPGAGNANLPEGRIAACDAIDAPIQRRVG